MKVYNKLVRDKIPEIITKDNKKAVTKILNDEEYLESNNIEELADIVEVIYGILEVKNISIEEFENVRKSKVQKRGAFKEKIFLEKVIEDGE